MSNQTNDSPIVIEGLRKAFGEQKVLDGINLKVAKGETVAVLGRSGGGKSVFLKLLIRLQTSDSGSIRIAGQEITKLNEKQLNDVRKKIGFLFQQAALYDSLTVEENVAFPFKRHTKKSAAEQKERVRELLADVGMDQDLEKLPSQISGGMQKRVGLARALAFFFFQAEDGIRDWSVTGVQTCAFRSQKVQALGSTWTDAYVFFKHEEKGIGPKLAADFQRLFG